MKLIYDGDILTHHGIKGQRWGDRNGPPYPLDSKAHSASEKKAGWKKSLDPKSVKKLERKKRELHERENQNYEKNLLKNSQDNKNPEDHKLTDSQKKTIRNVAIGVAAAAGIGVGMYFAYKHHAINNIADVMASGNADKSVLKHTMLRSLDDATMVFDKGSIFHRMSAYGGVDYSKATDPMYLSWKKVDIATYMTRLRDWSGTGKRFDVVFEAMEDIKIPTKKKAQEVFEDLWKSDPEYKKQLRTTLVETYKKLGESSLFAELHADKDLQDDPFTKAIYSIVRQSPDSKKLIDRFKTLGYDAIEDYFDIEGKMAESPVIVFNPSKTLTKKGETFVTKQMKIDTLKDLMKGGTTKMTAGTEYVSDILMAIRLGLL